MKFDNAHSISHFKDRNQILQLGHIWAPSFLTNIDDNCFMALDFCGPRPHGLMIL